MLRNGSRRTSLSLLAALMLGTWSVALADDDPPTISIRQRATLVSPVEIAVVVEVNCGDGPSTAAGVSVVVRQGDLTSNGSMVFNSTGARQEILVSVVPGPFAPGRAIASAQLGCATLLEGLILGATIKITAP